MPESTLLEHQANELPTVGPQQAAPTGGHSGLSTQHSALVDRLHPGAFATHLLLAVFFTWPLALNFLPGAGSLVPGYMLEDRDQNLWNLWWVSRAVLGGHNPFVTDMIWYPTPVSLYYHTLSVFNGLLAIPLLQVFSLTTTYNVIVLFSFAMGGYGAYLLVHYICGNRWAALTGSVVFAYSAYHIATMRGLLQMISLEWLPFFVLFLLLAVYQPPWRSRGDAARWLPVRAVPAALALLLVSLVDWYYAMYALMLAVFLAAYIAIRGWFRRRRQGNANTVWRRVGEPLSRVALCLGVYAALVSPVLLPMLRELRTAGYMQPAPDAALRNSADLLRFFQPPRFQQLWARNFTNWLAWPFADNRYEVYFTYTALFLAGVGLLAGGRGSVSTSGPDPRLPGKWFWAVCGLVFFSLSLGPVLQVNGQQIRWLPMPYNLVEHIPPLNISRSPDRFDMPLTLCLGVLAGYGVNVLMNTWLRGLSLAWRGSLIAVGAIALIALELAPMPFQQLPAGIPRWYERLGREQGDFSILELPPQDEFWHGEYRMYYQTAHGKRIFGGGISREFPHPFLRSTPGYQELTYVDGGGDMFKAGPDEWLSAFVLYKTRYIVLQKERYPGSTEPTPDVAPSREAIKKVLGAAAVPVYSDSELEAYGVPEPPTHVPFLSAGDGWEPREHNAGGETYRWMHGEGTLRIDSPSRQEAFFVFGAESLGKPRRIEIWHGDQRVFEGSVPAARQTFRIGPLGLPPGASTLRIVSLDGTTSPAKLGMADDPRELSVVLLGASLEPVSPNGPGSTHKDSSVFVGLTPDP